MGTYTQTTTFTNGTTADGGQVNTEIVNLGASVNDITNAQINSSAAIAISKTTLGTYTAWATYTPTYTASAGTWTITDSRVRWCQIGKVVFLQIFAIGTCNATPAYLRFTLPVAPTDTTDLHLGTGCTAYYAGTAIGGFAIYRNATAVMEIGAYDLAVKGNFTNAVSGSGVALTMTYEVS